MNNEEPLPLFREAVGKAAGERYLGSVNLSAPVSTRYWTLLALGFVWGVAAFLVYGSYARKASVSGQLVSTKAITVQQASSELEAMIVVPGNIISSVKIGTPVALRYKAHPYQKFGIYRGEVREIFPDPLGSATGRSSATTPTDVHYLVAVKLEEQSILGANGYEVLRAGMALDAEISLEERKLWQWLLHAAYPSPASPGVPSLRTEG